MVFMALLLSIFYWVCQSLLDLFLSYHISFFELVLGKNIDEIWGRLIVLCLFVIFGSHSQFTIDNRKKAEKALQISEERYRTLVENIPIGICRFTPEPESKILMANPAFLKMFAFTSYDELNDYPARRLFLTSGESKKFSDELLNHGKLFCSEILLRRKNGEPVWGAITAKVVHSPDKNAAVYFDCTFEDIDAKKKASIKARKEAETRRLFQKMLSPDLAEMVVSGKLKVEKGGEKRIATVMFADIRDFTTFSEHTEATEVLKMLNEYFEMIVDIIFRHHGTIDKFIGDAVMVLWGAPIYQEKGPVQAVNAAMEMQSMVKKFNKKRNAAGKRPIQIGIGINTGKLVAGYIGSSQTMSYSVVGDTVNTASRLCSVAKPGEIIISESTYAHVKNLFKAAKINSLQLKGKKKPIEVYNVKGIKSRH